MPERKTSGPKGQAAAVRSALLLAAGEVIEERGLAGLTHREVATRAGVTSPMVKYYFQSTHGLLATLLESGFDSMVEGVGRATAEAQGEIREILRAVAEEIRIRPWLPILMVQGVFGGVKLRETFVSRVGPRIRAILLGLVELAAEQRRLRPGLDPDLTPLSMISVLVFPFLARPVVQDVFNFELDQDTTQRLADQLVALILQDDLSEGAQE